VARRGKGAAGTASGVVLDTRGHVITAGHVVAAARESRVVFPSGISRRGRVLGRDPQTDMALIKIERPPRGLTAARLGDSRDVTVGDWVLAVGSPLGLDQTITVGIVSALARNPASDEVVAHRVRRFIETDAKINPGSSGGPLVSLSGEVVGINTLINAGPGGSYGFAVPVNEARRVAQALLAEGRVRYAYLGVALRDVSDLDAEERRRTAPGLGLRGAVVSRVLDGAPASRAGLEPGDVITSIDNQEMAAADDIVDYVADRVVGTQVTVGYVRRGTCGVARLRLDELPREHAAE
jgi:serine protease Do